VTAISLICTLRNEGPSLPRILPFWLQVAAIDRIILLDYGSTYPLTDRILELDPRLHLIRVENAPYWKPGQAANLAIGEASEGVVLQLDANLYCPSERAAALRALEPGQFATNGGIGATGALALYRQDWAQQGGYHEFMVGRPNIASDFHHRLVASGATCRSFAPGDLQAIEKSPQGRSEAGAPNRLGLPAELTQSTDFIRQRNHVLTRLVPWEPALRAPIQRRVLGLRHLEFTLGPPSLFELRAVELANVITATFFVTEKERWLGEWMQALFFEWEIGFGPNQIFPALAGGAASRRSE
jgi:hypothetical protein